MEEVWRNDSTPVKPKSDSSVSDAKTVGADKLTVGALLDGSGTSSLESGGQERDVVGLIAGDFLHVEAKTGDSSNGVERSLVVHLAIAQVRNLLVASKEGL